MSLREIWLRIIEALEFIWNYPIPWLHLIFWPLFLLAIYTAAVLLYRYRRNFLVWQMVAALTWRHRENLRIAWQMFRHRHERRSR